MDTPSTATNQTLLPDGFHGKVVGPETLDHFIESVHTTLMSLKELRDRAVKLCKPPMPPEPLEGMACPPKPPAFNDLSSGLLERADQVLS